MKKFLLIVLIFIFFTSCQASKDAFSIKKKDDSDQFLVKKKNPLVQPPNFNKLPKPDNQINDQDENKTFELNVKSQNSISENATNNESGSVENSVLNKIKRNEFN